MQLYLAAVLWQKPRRCSEKTGTDHPVYLISRKYHSSPGQMRLHLMEALHTIRKVPTRCLLPWDSAEGHGKIDTEKRIVIPKLTIA